MAVGCLQLETQTATILSIAGKQKRINRLEPHVSTVGTLMDLRRTVQMLKGCVLDVIGACLPK